MTPRLLRRGKAAPKAKASPNGTVARPDLRPPASRRPRTIPRHVAIIMDGNGRWANERGLSRQKGHRAGAENIRRVIRGMGERGVEVLTLYAFSTENWTRPRTEVSALIRLIPRFIKSELKELHENGVRLVHIGDLQALDQNIRKQVEDAIELTKGNRRMTVALAFNYGGRTEIVEAVRRIVAEKTPAARIDEALLSSHLYTAAIGDPDLIVRTAGEMRLSNFLLWQAAYAEFYSTPAYWPDFDGAEMDRALDAYAQRVRKFGAVEPRAVRNGAKPSK
ncbi:MAG TPA: polyprenyl diphosphate synthase [Dehalococcoidia bacterium]|nr:polyprenyl diphosphate synthase [Dehalococcoidia bacterium]